MSHLIPTTWCGSSWRMTAKSPQECRLTVGDASRAFRADRDRAWTLVEATLKRVAPEEAVSLCTRWVPAEDLVQETLVRVFDRGGRVLRRAPPEIVLAPWLREVARRVGREMRRARESFVGSGLIRPKFADVQPVDHKPKARPLRHVPALVELDAECLSEKQRHAWRLLLRGRSFTKIAERCGISRQAALDRVRTGLERMAAVRPAAKDDRAWARRVLASPRARIDRERRRLLTLYARGKTFLEIADSCSISPEAARSRIRRLRAKMRPGTSGRPPR